MLVVLDAKRLEAREIVAHTMENGVGLGLDDAFASLAAAMFGCVSATRNQTEERSQKRSS